jgi:cation diffusion facilitator family transporter
MNHTKQDTWQHDHCFGQDIRRSGEKRTIIVLALTTVTMVVEISAGLVFGSMALLADGLHMASHAAALSINAFVYVYARKHAADPSFSFGTGKMNALGGFTGAILLLIFALAMVYESFDRLLFPVDIAYNQAIAVAVLGLVVNGISVFLLGHGHEQSQDHGHEHGCAHAHHDHNLKAAYLHVLADTLTSVLAIGALLTAKYAGLIWMDPIMGLVGAYLVSRWSIGLLKNTGSVLLDKEDAGELRTAIREALESREDRIDDLHVWSIGPGIFAAIVSIASNEPKSPNEYKQKLPHNVDLVHVTIEVNPLHELLSSEKK